MFLQVFLSLSQLIFIDADQRFSSCKTSKRPQWHLCEMNTTLSWVLEAWIIHFHCIRHNFSIDIMRRPLF